MFKKIFYFFLNLIIYFLILEIALALAGAIFAWQQNGLNTAHLTGKKQLKIMCLGESTTAAGGKDAYPVQLQEILKARVPAIKFTVYNKGVPGITSKYIVAHLEENLQTCAPDIVITMLGHSDSYLVKTVYDRPGFWENFRSFKLIKIFFRHFFKKDKDLDLQPTQPAGRSGQAPKNISREIVFALQELNGRNFQKAEKILKRALRQDQTNQRAWLLLGYVYVQTEKYTRAEKCFLNILTLPEKSRENKYSAYLELGKLAKLYGNFAQAENYFLQATDLNSRSAQAWLELGWLWLLQNDQARAGFYIRKAGSLPDNGNWPELLRSWSFSERGDYQKARSVLEGILTKDPNNYWLYIEMARILNKENKFAVAGVFIEKALKLKPADELAYINIGDIYFYQKKYEQAARMYELARRINPNNDRPPAALANLYAQKKDFGSAKKYAALTDRIRNKYSSVMLKKDYRAIKQMLDARNITMICVQYPLRNIQPLKKIFSDQPALVFVDNEKLFKQAVAKDGYATYFVDNWGGDFGHCTRAGNRLLAENIAKVVIEQTQADKVK